MSIVSFQQPLFLFLFLFILFFSIIIGRYALRLGGYIALTGEGHQLILPNKEYALLVATEFDNQHTFIYPHTMPMTNLALTVFDRIPRERDEMTQHMVNCCEFDAACYRELPEDNPALNRLYRKHYDPLLKWLKLEFNCPLHVTTDFSPIEQPPQSLAIMANLIKSQPTWNFAILEQACFMSKSVVAGLAFLHGRVNIEQVIKAARIEENYQADENGRVGGMYGNIVGEQHTHLRYAALRVAQNILGRDI